MQISRKEFKELLRSVGKDELKSMLKEILEEEGELKVGNKPLISEMTKCIYLLILQSAILRELKPVRRTSR